MKTVLITMALLLTSYLSGQCDFDQEKLIYSGDKYIEVCMGKDVIEIVGNAKLGGPGIEIEGANSIIIDLEQNEVLAYDFSSITIPCKTQMEKVSHDDGQLFLRYKFGSSVLYYGD